MPIQSGKGGFDFNKALQKHAADPTDYGQDFTRLPGGITGGVAKLIEMKIGVYKSGDLKGKKFFRAVGTVESPVSVTETSKVWDQELAAKAKDQKDPKRGIKIVSTKEVRIRGLQTSIMEPLCVTKKNDFKTGEEVTVSEEEHVDNMLNELRKLGGEEFTAPLASATNAEAELDSMMKVLVSQAVRFKFGTRTPDPTAKYPEPRTFEQWYGSKDVNNEAANESSSEASGPVDNSGGEGASSSSLDDDLDSLLETAQDDSAEGQSAAQDRLKELYLANHTEDDFNAIQQWADLVDALKAEADGTEGGESGGEGADETTEEATEGAGEETTTEGEGPTPPTKGDVVKFQPMDPKTKKPAINKAKKPLLIDVQIVSVDTKTSTCVVKDLRDKKTLIKNVAWTRLIVE